jgi:hypothetical protein
VNFPGRRFFGDGVGPGLFLGFFCLRRWVGLLGFAVASAVCLRASCIASVGLPFRWHPRYGVCSSRVAPVRGGTYFSLPPQRKVGKRKRLTPPTLGVCPRALNVPTLHTAAQLFAFAANALNERLTRFEYPYLSERQRMVYAAQVANCV